MKDTTNRISKLRIALFCGLMAWSIYLSAGYAWEISRTEKVFSKLISDPQNGSLYVDGTDFSPLVTLFGYGAKGILSVFDVVMFGALLLIYAAIIAVFVSVPALILRRALLKNRSISAEEYNLTKIIYLIGTGATVAAGLIATKFTAVFVVVIYSALSALLTMIYVSKAKSRAAECGYSV